MSLLNLQKLRYDNFTVCKYITTWFVVSAIKTLSFRVLYQQAPMSKNTETEVQKMISNSQKNRNYIWWKENYKAWIFWITVGVCYLLLSSIKIKETSTGINSRHQWDNSNQEFGDLYVMLYDDSHEHFLARCTPITCENYYRARVQNTFEIFCTFEFCLSYLWISVKLHIHDKLSK